MIFKPNMRQIIGAFMLICMVVAITLCATGNTAIAGEVEVATIEEKNTIKVASSAEGIRAAAAGNFAGIFKRVNQINEIANSEDSQVETISEDGAMMASAAPVVEPVKYPEWENRIISNVDTNMNIRSGPSLDYEVIGIFRRGDIGEIVDYEENWYHITTGAVDGYVIEDYVLVGDEAKEFADEVCNIFATTTETGLRVRAMPSTDAEVYKQLELGDKLVVDKEAEQVDGWVTVNVGDKVGYVSADYVDVAMSYSEGITLAEAAEIEKEKQAEILREKARLAAESAAKAYNEVIKPAYPATDYEIRLMAAVIQSEAGGEPYYGQVAVASVIMNRVRSGLFPGTISDVIYQPSQFYTARVDSLINNPQQSCIEAALEAVGGRDNVEGRIGFMRSIHGHSGLTIGHHTFFYAYEW